MLTGPCFKNHSTWEGDKGLNLLGDLSALEDREPQESLELPGGKNR
jgi:hypothetical protein